MSRKRNGYPIKLERWYYRKQVQMVREWQEQANKSLNLIEPFVKGGTKILTDADNSNNPDWMHYVQQVLDLMSSDIKNCQTDQELDSVTRRYVIAISSFSANKVRQRVGTIKIKTGIVALNPLKDNAKLREYVTGKIIENTNLIKTMRQRYIDQTKADIYRSINSGGGVSDLAHSIVARTGMTLRHADLIATDQTGKILAQIDKYRNMQTGSTRYIWRSMEDRRVRPKHRELDGKEFKYDDPTGGDDGQLPGEPIRCRCYADPVD